MSTSLPSAAVGSVDDDQDEAQQDAIQWACMIDDEADEVNSAEAGRSPIQRELSSTNDVMEAGRGDETSWRKKIRAMRL